MAPDLDRPHPDPLEGTPYRSLRFLGRGGMGVVVEAEHRTLGKRVAIKVLANIDGEAPSEKEEDRLRVEAETLARIANPHVLDVTDLGRSPGGQLYVVMELLRGRSLADELKSRGRLSAPEAAGFALHVLRGLAAAHAIGVIHRDLKPANIYLCDAVGTVSPSDPLSGRKARVLDFGVAKVLGAAEGPRGPVHPTAEGMVLGTPRYLTPEHLGVSPVDQRTDIYGVGLLLYVMLTGRGPFDDERGMAGFARAAAYDTPPPPSSLAPLPAGLEAVVLRCLEKQKEARYPSADALIAALTPFFVPAQTAARTQRQLATELLPSPAPPKVAAPNISPHFAERGVQAQPERLPRALEKLAVSSSATKAQRTLAFWGALISTVLVVLVIFAVTVHLLGVPLPWGKL